MYVAQVVRTQIYYQAKSGNRCLINYDTECSFRDSENQRECSVHTGAVLAVSYIEKGL